MNSKRIIYILQLLFILGAYSCEDETPPYELLTDSKEGTNIFLAKANSGIEKLTIFPADENERRTTIGSGFGGLGIPANDIEVTLSINIEALDSINNARILNGSEPFELFPENAFSFDKMILTIKAGTLYSDISTLTYYPANFDQEKAYLLPVSISNASGFPISKTAKTIVFQAPKGPKLITTPVPLNKNGWQVSDFSSQEDLGEGSNGFARNVIDNNPDSYWHSCWWACESNETTAHPHWLTIDMNNLNTIDGIRFHQRQSNSRAVKEIEILLSDDNSSWTSIGNYTLEQKIAPQDISFDSSMEARYVKVIAISAWDGTNFAAMGEISPYSVEETYVFED